MNDFEYVAFNEFGVKLKLDLSNIGPNGIIIIKKIKLPKPKNSI